MEDNDLKLNDYLAIERTNLANERTLLAYFRTFIILLSSGFAIVKLDFLKEINILGFVLLLMSPLIMVFGIFRYYKMKRRILNHYKKE